MSIFMCEFYVERLALILRAVSYFYVGKVDKRTMLVANVRKNMLGVSSGVQESQGRSVSVDNQ